MSWFSKTKDQLKGVAGGRGRVVLTKDAAAEAQVILAPRITEKAANSTGQNIYTFNVHPQANKRQIKRAVEVIYSVQPTKVRVVNLPAKSITRRGILGRKARGRKAYVHLRATDKIEIM